MKFYREKKTSGYWQIIKSFKLTAVYSLHFVIFFKNGLRHNSKNAAYIAGRIPDFWLNGIFYGSKKEFSKKSWRKFVKLQAFI
jgi:hypothetical protein